MRKLSVLLLVLALLAAAGAYQLRQWQTQTAAQREAVLAQAAGTAAFLARTPEPWTNAAAEEALAFRPADREQEGLYEYVSPEEIRFISHSETWDEAGLRALYEELLRNRHGEELNTLERIVVYAEEDEFAAATHRNTTWTVPVSLHFPLVGEDPIFSFYVSGGQINLYGGDRKTTTDAMAAELAHEYGHHYTLTYLLPGGGSAMDLYRTYAQLRGLNSENTYTRISDEQFYYDNHMHYLVEIAAEDYLVLMGSPNAMSEIGDYTDIRAYANGEEGDLYLRRNATPQENMFLPFAANVPGLADYFYSFLDEPAPEYPKTGDMGLQFDRRAKSYNLTTGYRTFVSYKLTWNKTLGEDAVYTLLCLDPESERIHPVVTVYPGEAAEAELGEITVSSADYVTWYTDSLAEGTKQFLVVVTLPDGRVAVSDPMEKTF